MKRAKPFFSKTGKMIYQKYMTNQDEVRIERKETNNKNQDIVDNDEM